MSPAPRTPDTGAPATGRRPGTTAAPAPPVRPRRRDPAAEPPQDTATRLVALAAARATGALLTDRGVLYLLDGRVVHAEAPQAPGMDLLLTVGGLLTPEDWDRAVARAGARHRVGAHLVESGLLGRGELEMCHLTAVCDAAFFVLRPPAPSPASGNPADRPDPGPEPPGPLPDRPVAGDGPAKAAPPRFRAGARHWIGPSHPVDADRLVREARRRRAMLERAWPTADLDEAPVRLADPPPRSVLLPPRHRAVLALADGSRTPAAIARQLGRPAFHTLLDVRRLAASGHLAATPGPEPPAGPERRPADLSGTPDLATLHRIRDALEATL
ncbi:transcriptional regulator [Streptomyces sp. NPDC059740]|uniref:transcriptional regulator n=1 Tax=Streptomyces sp. NPDC059740 TaxID=3346926 RepID=UPI00365B1368